jgi:peptide/nickel transport system permease protein
LIAQASPDSDAIPITAMAWGLAHISIRQTEMVRFFLRRIAALVLMLFVISLVVFAVTSILPGDAASVILGKQATPEALTALRARLGLDQPAVPRYLTWLGGALRGDWGESIQMSIPVLPLLIQRLRNSAVLGIGAILFGVPLGIALGTVAALKRNQLLDRLITISTIFLVSFPGFVTATWLIIIFAAWLRWLPASSLMDPDVDILSSFRALVLPTLTLVFGMTAHIARMTRSNLLETLGSDYIRTAVAKGLSSRAVILRHALRNALLPTISVIALQVGWILSGVVLVETVFSYPGLGRLMAQAITARDIPLLQAAVVLTAAIYALANLGADVLYFILNPRIRYT